MLGYESSLPAGHRRTFQLQKEDSSCITVLENPAPNPRASAAESSVCRLETRIGSSENFASPPRASLGSRRSSKRLRQGHRRRQAHLPLPRPPRFPARRPKHANDPLRRVRRLQSAQRPRARQLPRPRRAPPRLGRSPSALAIEALRKLNVELEEAPLEPEDSISLREEISNLR